MDTELTHKNIITSEHWTAGVKFTISSFDKTIIVC